jgi:hypothetical protein
MCVGAGEFAGQFHRIRDGKKWPWKMLNSDHSVKYRSQLFILVAFRKIAKSAY